MALSRLTHGTVGLRTTAWLVVIGAGVWSVALIVGPVLRPDLDPLTAHPEGYAQGPWALVMRLGYVGIAIAGAAAAFLAQRYRIAAALLAMFGTGALLIGFLPPAGEATLADTLFPYVQLAPLAFLPAIAWISWRERQRVLLVLAALTWLLFLPLVFGEPPLGGLLNRAADPADGGVARIVRQDFSGSAARGRGVKAGIRIRAASTGGSDRGWKHGSVDHAIRRISSVSTPWPSWPSPPGTSRRELMERRPAG